MWNLSDHYSYQIGDLVMLKDGDFRGMIGIIVSKGMIWSELLRRHCPEYDIQIEKRLLRCMSGFYMEKIG